MFARNPARSRHPRPAFGRSRSTAVARPWRSCCAASFIPSCCPTSTFTRSDPRPPLTPTPGTPVELELCIHDFSGSVLEDEAAPRRIRAFVELARAFLHAYQNIDSLTESRMTTLAGQVDILLEPSEPGVESSGRAGRDEIDALWTYVITVFETDSVRERILNALSPPARETYMTMEDLLARGEQRGLSKGRAEGLSKGRAEGLSKGRALAVLDLLELRALPTPARVRLRVLATRDESLLCRWFARALTVASAEDLFESVGR